MIALHQIVSRQLRPLQLFLLAMMMAAPVAAQTGNAPAAAPTAKPNPQGPDTVSSNPEYADFYTGQSGNDKPKGIEWVPSIHVSSPAYCSEIKGDVTVNFSAPGMAKAEALCWQQPTKDNSNPWGHDAVVATLNLDASENGSFVFQADQFPHGPLIVRIHAKSEGKIQDMCQLQLFNQGGVVWDQGIPKSAPPAAEGMKLAFADDFSKPLSSSPNGAGATYESHKTGGGDFSGWQFTSADSPLNPFSQVGTWLRIHASKPPGTKGSSGIISSLHEDGTGFTAKAPCYFECRLLAQSAPGTWPAFWLLTQNPKGVKEGDELDVIEAYGGMGPGNPNFLGYACTSHFWNQSKPDWDQKGPDGTQQYHSHIDVPMLSLGGKSSWSTTFHTYGIKITPTDTIYYFDNIEVLRHPTTKDSASRPLWFLINYAIGGISGWHIDLERYNNQTDMWVDWVRVYQG